MTDFNLPSQSIQYSGLLIRTPEHGKSFKMDLKICKVADGIKGAAISALVQGLLMPPKGCLVFFK